MQPPTLEVSAKQPQRKTGAEGLSGKTVPSARVRFQQPTIPGNVGVAERSNLKPADNGSGLKSQYPFEAFEYREYLEVRESRNGRCLL